MQGEEIKLFIFITLLLSPVRPASAYLGETVLQSAAIYLSSELCTVKLQDFTLLDLFSEWLPLIGSDTPRYSALIGLLICTPALWCHKDTVPGTQSFSTFGAYLKKKMIFPLEKLKILRIFPQFSPQTPLTPPTP